MKYKKKIEDNYNLHIIKTDKFKKNKIEIIFRTKLNEKEFLHQKLIGDILLESNSIYNTKRLLAIKTESLYNLSASNSAHISGNVLDVSFSFSFLNDKYSEDGLFKDIVKFFSEVIFKPQVEDEKFNQDALDLAKKRLKEDIKSIKESPMSYTYENVYKIIGKGTPLEISLYGKEDLVDKVDAHELYLSYLKLLKESTVDIFVIGDIEEKSVETVFKEEFNISTYKHESYNHYVEYKKYKDKFVTKKESLDNNQSILLLAYKIKDLTFFERNYVLPIYSYILGGGPDSKLFKNVREKNSLCYSIGSQVKNIYNLLFITAGINACNYKKALILIKKEVDSMNNGKFDEKDIKKAKLTYISAIKESNDSIHSILNSYVSHEFIGSDYLEDREKNINKVTKEDIMNVIPKIHPELIYFLEGTKDNEKDGTC